MLTKKLIV